MTADTLTPHAPVTLCTADGATLDAKVDFIDRARLTVVVPESRCPIVGAPVTLRWPAGPRGRYALPGTVAQLIRPAGTGPTKLVVETVGEPTLEQHRRFVRGGGGEPVMLKVRGGILEGRLYDIGEQGLRARFHGLRTSEGAEVTATVKLEPDTITVHGTVLKLATRPDEVDIVIKFETDEEQATLIRRYVLRRQMQERARQAELERER